MARDRPGNRVTSKVTAKKRRNWGGARPGAGRPKGSGTGTSPDARVHRVAIMLSPVELERLSSLAEEAGKPVATLAYELVVRGLRRPRSI